MSLQRFCEKIKNGGPAEVGYKTVELVFTAAQKKLLPSSRIYSRS